jgi:hypothetical protein
MTIIAQLILSLIVSNAYGAAQLEHLPAKSGDVAPVGTPDTSTEASRSGRTNQEGQGAQDAAPDEMDDPSTQAATCTICDRNVINKATLTGETPVKAGDQAVQTVFEKGKGEGKKGDSGVFN